MAALRPPGSARGGQPESPARTGPVGIGDGDSPGESWTLLHQWGDCQWDTSLLSRASALRPCRPPGRMAMGNLDAITVTQSVGLQVTHWVSYRGPRHRDHGWGPKAAETDPSQAQGAAVRAQHAGSIGPSSEPLRDHSPCRSLGSRPSSGFLGS